jgi:hypothetical protein
LGNGHVGFPHHFHQLVVDDLDELLIRRHPQDDLGSQGSFPHILDELLHHLQIDIRIQQGSPHLPQSFLNVGFGDLVLAAQLSPGQFQLLGEGIKHGYCGSCQALWGHFLP